MKEKVGLLALLPRKTACSVSVARVKRLVYSSTMYQFLIFSSTFSLSLPFPSWDAAIYLQIENEIIVDGLLSS